MEEGSYVFPFQRAFQHCCGRKSPSPKKKLRLGELGEANEVELSRLVLGVSQLLSNGLPSGVITL